MSILKGFFKREVQPAMGCTEPVAVALAVAKARELVSGETIYLGDVVSLKVYLSNNIYKNGNQVGIPGSNGKVGNYYAASLALCFGDSNDGLQIFKNLEDSDLLRVQEVVESNKVSISSISTKHDLYVEVELETKDAKSKVIISGFHSNFVYYSLNGNELFSKEEEEITSYYDYPIFGNGIHYADLLRYVEILDQSDREYIEEAIHMNMRIAEYGLTHDVGFGVGRSILAEYSSLFDLNEFNNAPLSERIRAYSAAASDARMHGVFLPVMSSAGSGNHGIVTIIPVYLFGKEKKYPISDIEDAVLVSLLTCSYIKLSLGRLSAVCGCSVAAGAAAAAGITYLETKNPICCQNAMNFVFANLSGLVCDGAKFSCALKVATGAEEAYRSAILAINNTQIHSQGLVENDVSETIINLHQLNSEIMNGFDEFVIKAIKERNSNNVRRNFYD